MAMKTFAIYDKSRKSIYVGSPQFNIYNFQRFLDKHSFLEFIPEELSNYMVAGNGIITARNRNGDYIFLKEYKIRFPFLISSKKRKQIMEGSFDEFRIRKK